MWIKVEGNQHYYLGKYKVGAVFYDSFNTIKGSTKYKCIINLVGLKNSLGVFNSLEEGMEMFEKVLEQWLVNSQLVKMEK